MEIDEATLPEFELISVLKLEMEGGQFVDRQIKGQDEVVC